MKVITDIPTKIYDLVSPFLNLWYGRTKANKQLSFKCSHKIKFSESKFWTLWFDRMSRLNKAWRQISSQQIQDGSKITVLFQWVLLRKEVSWMVLWCPEWIDRELVKAIHPLFKSYWINTTGF